MVVELMNAKILHRTKILSYFSTCYLGMLPNYYLGGRRRVLVLICSSLFQNATAAAGQLAKKVKHLPILMTEEVILVFLHLDFQDHNRNNHHGGKKY
jgi:hypothetical protein